MFFPNFYINFSSIDFEFLSDNGWRIWIYETRNPTMQSGKISISDLLRQLSHGGSRWHVGSDGSVWQQMHELFDASRSNV